MIVLSYYHVVLADSNFERGKNRSLEVDFWHVCFANGTLVIKPYGKVEFVFLRNTYFSIALLEARQLFAMTLQSVLSRREK